MVEATHAYMPPTTATKILITLKGRRLSKSQVSYYNWVGRHPKKYYLFVRLVFFFFFK
jgi:hypothetical protein